jgi:hypothetical protein
MCYQRCRWENGGELTNLLLIRGSGVRIPPGALSLNYHAAITITELSGNHQVAVNPYIARTPGIGQYLLHYHFPTGLLGCVGWLVLEFGLAWRVRLQPAAYDGGHPGEYSMLRHWHLQ